MSARDDYPNYGHYTRHNTMCDEIDRLRAQLERIRAELTGTAARIAAWDDALGAIVPELEREMAAERPRLVEP